ncbi:MAG TPA: hypothetical protein VG994_02670 [Steroidobacteraceae bacterium]|nr:hypothetical protein [Steroidobacteraceae bacterium]
MATAKKRQAIPRVIVPALEVARDAVREGQSPAVVVECAGSESKLALGIELLRAATALLAAEGVYHLTAGVYNGTTMLTIAADEPTDVDRHHATLATLVTERGFSDHAPFNQTSGDSAYRTCTVTIGDAQISLSSRTRHRCARKADGRQCTGENGHDGDHTFEGGAK